MKDRFLHLNCSDFKTQPEVGSETEAKSRT